MRRVPAAYSRRVSCTVRSDLRERRCLGETYLLAWPARETALELEQGAADLVADGRLALVVVDDWGRGHGTTLAAPAGEEAPPARRGCCCYGDMLAAAEDAAARRSGRCRGATAAAAEEPAAPGGGVCGGGVCVHVGR